MKARIVTQPGKDAYVEIQRAKCKHWFRFGRHKEGDNALRRGIAQGEVEWVIIEPKKLF